MEIGHSGSPDDSREAGEATRMWRMLDWTGDFEHLTGDLVLG